MCGITGFITEKKINNDELLLNLDKMIKSINHRGPDNSGKWIFDNSVYFGHTRLSIQDLSDNAKQPMVSNNRQYCLIFNGEIYNHLLLKNSLDYAWKTSSDTETILALFEKYGVIESIKKIEGMFSLVCFDIKNKKIYMARDYSGEKPLYFGWSNNLFLFGSELKSLTANSYFKKIINKDSVNSLIQYSYIKTPLTIYKNIFKLPPGNIFESSIDIYDFKNNKVRDIYEKNNFFKIYNYSNIFKDKSEKIFTNSLSGNIKEFSDIFSKTINSYFLSDVPVGVFLSGGIDSTLTTLFAKKYTSNNFDTYSIGFENYEFDESSYAEKISNYLGVKNHKLILTSNDMQNVIPKIPKIYDEPFSDSSQIPTFLLSKLASSNLKVVLSGDGGDELFGGYNRYFLTQKLWNTIKFFPFEIRNIFSKLFLKYNNLIYFFLPLLSLVVKKKLSYEKALKIFQKLIIIKDKKTLYLSMIKETNDIQDYNPELTINFDEDFDNYISNSDNFLEAMMNYDFNTYLNDDILVKVDRASMANSLEVRAPFLDKSIINFSHSLPINQKINNNEGKYLLRQILNKELPEDLIKRPKMGFGIPLREWLSNDLNSWMNDVLSNQNLNKHSLFKNEIILDMVKNIDNTSINKLWSVLVFQIWYEENF